jgi:ABC-type multidrug transport system ATPase subunit
MSKIAYVKQQDVFFQHLTILDQLTYTALLRLPSSLPKSEKIAEVNRTIKLLRLSKVADSPIMLLSGGEKKRVNICTELLTDPVVLLLDEPTSGLDSTSAVALLRTLQRLAQEHGKTVVTSIHQPSSAVFRSFDRLLLLAEGNVVYFGTPFDSLSYLRQHNLTCPDGYNAADHWMDLLVVDSALEEEKEDETRDEIGRTTLTMMESTSDSDEQPPTGTLRRRRNAPISHYSSPRARLIEAWDGEAVAEQMDAALADSKDTDSQATSFSSVQKYNTSWTTQFAVLTHRSLKNSRSAIFTPLNLVKSLAIGIVTGLLWWQLPYTEGAVFDRSSYYFFTMTYWVFE